MKKTKWLTATNILILVIIGCYILDRYIIPIPKDYTGFTWNSQIQVEGVEEIPDVVFQILGFCGGRLTNLFGLLGTNFNPNGRAFYRFFTVFFTHAFIMHLVVNMVGLYFIGNFVEKKLGPLLTIILFFVTGVLEGLITDPLYQLYDPTTNINETVCVGASGAIFGLMGIGLVICLLNKEKFKIMKTSHKVILAIYGVVFTYLANGTLISWTTFAHNDGLIIGILTMLLLYFVSPKIKERLSS